MPGARPLAGGSDRAGPDPPIDARTTAASFFLRGPVRVARDETDGRRRFAISAESFPAGYVRMRPEACTTGRDRGRPGTTPQSNTRFWLVRRAGSWPRARGPFVPDHKTVSRSSKNVDPAEGVRL